MKIAVISDKIIDYNSELCAADYYPSESVVTPSDWAEYDAAFLVDPISEIAVNKWTGHPHLRHLHSEGELDFEIAFLLTNIECEKKLLIEIPSEDIFSKYHAFKSEIEQIYLISDNGTHRIRKRISAGSKAYFETRKIYVSPTKCNEYEHRISEEKYEELKLKADPECKPIHKFRYCFLYKYQYFELDVYDFWKNNATLELELKRENEPFFLPPEISVIKDVSKDRAYKNHQLARIDYEDCKTELL